MFIIPSSPRSLLFLILLVSGFLGIISSADYSIGTTIETSGMVHEEFSGNWDVHTNDTSGSGVFSDSEMSNGGNFSVNKQINMKDSITGNPEINHQKLIQFSAGNSGSHMIADEYMIMSSEKYSNDSFNTICFSDPYYNKSSNAVFSQSAAFTIANAKNLVLSSSSRYTDGFLDYVIQTGNPTNNTTGMNGILQTHFEGKSVIDGYDTSLYDRTLISGLINSFSRMYHSGENIELTGSLSGNGMVTEKTVMKEEYIGNSSESGSPEYGSSVYSANVIINGGKTNETRQLSGYQGITGDRVITYQSEGDKSILESESIITTRNSGSNSDNQTLQCVFGKEGTSNKSDIKSPYKMSSAQSGVTGVSSARISSSTVMNDLSSTTTPNLEYHADISIPIDFNPSITQKMKDSDMDGRYEDLNGNGHLDMNDLVLLFQNFRWIGESNVSTRIDFNKNGRADYADIVTVFRAMNQTGSNTD